MEMIVPPSYGKGKIIKHSFKMLCTELAYCERSLVVAGDGGGDGSVTAVSIGSSSSEKVVWRCSLVKITVPFLFTLGYIFCVKVSGCADGRNWGHGRKG